MSLLDTIAAAQAGAPPPFGQAPTAVRLVEAGAQLSLEEAEGPPTAVSAHALRLACRCAWCTRARIDGSFPTRFEAVSVTNAELIGGYALRLHFSDGHDRGIFPWSFLREIAAAEASAPLPAEDTHHA
jgi:DUF971 family protein